MSKDTEKERRRLTELYASMSSEQLQQITSQSSDLTDIAHSALVAEMKRRELTDITTPAGTYPSNELLDSKRVVIRSFRDLFEAQVAKAFLDGADIESFLADDNLVRMDWLVSNAIGGVKLLVREADVADALTVLDQPIPESFEVDGVGEYTQPRCPQCGSLDVNFGNQPLVYGSLFDSNPVPTPIHGWYCQKCSHTWQDPLEDDQRE